MKKAVFITLDNTLITTLSGKSYSVHSEDWKFKDNILNVIKDYYNKDYKVCVICNQFQVTYGLTTPKAFLKKLEDVITNIEKALKLRKNSISYSYCFEADSYRALPNPGLIFELACDYELDVKNSCFIGSSYDDRKSAEEVGIVNYFDITDL